MPDPIIWKDQNGSIRELRAGFYIRQPSSSSHAERENAARHACEAEGRRMIEEWNKAPIPMKFEFYSVNLVGMEGVTTKTETNPWTGERHHECKGTGVAHLLYILKVRDAPFAPESLRKDAAESKEDGWTQPETWAVKGHT